MTTSLMTNSSAVYAQSANSSDANGWKCECGGYLKKPSPTKIQKHIQTKTHLKRTSPSKNENIITPYIPFASEKPKYRDLFMERYIYNEFNEPCPFCGYSGCHCGSGY